MSEIDFIGIEWNQELIVELGVLISDHKDTNVNMTLDKIDMIFSKQGNIKIYKVILNRRLNHILSATFDHILIHNLI